MIDESKISKRIEKNETEEEINVAEIINSLREKKEELYKTKATNQGKNFETNYIKKVEEGINYDRENKIEWEDSKEFKYLVDKLENNLIIDFGSGTSGSVCNAISLLSRLKIKAYVGVDPYWASDEDNIIEYLEKGYFGVKGNTEEAVNITKDRERFLILCTDILSALKELPDECCHIMMNGIDSTIISNMSEKYLKELKDEIKRVIKKQGIVFGNGFIPKEDLLVNFSNNKKKAPFNFAIYEKIQEEKNEK